MSKLELATKAISNVAAILVGGALKAEAVNYLGNVFSERLGGIAKLATGTPHARRTRALAKGNTDVFSARERIGPAAHKPTTRFGKKKAPTLDS